jgi:hypothetical protein
VLGFIITRGYKRMLNKDEDMKLTIFAAIVACLFLLDSRPLPCNRRHGSIAGIK